MEKKEVSREEFDALVEKVNKLEKITDDQTLLLQEIDKKLDVITEKLSSSKTIEELKIKPIEEKVNKIEDNNRWLWRTIVGVIVGILINGLITIKNIK
jgi:iron-sulfur cluster repair protein YtfE (RIC family)